jgi:hypothetical protein
MAQIRHCPADGGRTFHAIGLWVSSLVVNSTPVSRRSAAHKGDAEEGEKYAIVLG